MEEGEVATCSELHVLAGSPLLSELAFRCALWPENSGDRGDPAAQRVGADQWLALINGLAPFDGLALISGLAPFDAPPCAL
jgi:hypothetical protein